jgi:hypothetical protein
MTAFRMVRSSSSAAVNVRCARWLPFGISPAQLDVVEFRSVPRQPLDRDPLPRRERCHAGFRTRATALSSKPVCELAHQPLHLIVQLGADPHSSPKCSRKIVMLR